MKVFMMVLAIWAIAIIIFFAGFWCGKRVTEMLINSKKAKKDNEDGDKN